MARDFPRHGDLESASVLITGGGSGIGASLTEGFLRQGAKVAFIDIDAAASEALCDRLEREHGARPLFLKADLTDIASLREAVAAAAKAHGPVSVLVNNAARDDRHAVDKLTPEEWDASQAINLRPLFFAAQAVAPGMKAAGRGAIVNFSSIAFMLNGGDYPAYAAAKAGIIGLTKSLAGALGPHGIRVNAIAPGMVITERQLKLWLDEDIIASHVGGRQCLKQRITADDMVGPCLFLASDAARMVTAQTLIVDGGVM
ncbi:MAG: SDR family oxidoreductase [Rhizobiaceae bacterium]|nr:SDR family oxidoreductase [Rhizobiaceae bacterium]